jgi:hypothetical protein
MPYLFSFDCQIFRENGLKSVTRKILEAEAEPIENEENSPQTLAERAMSTSKVKLWLETALKEESS